MFVCVCVWMFILSVNKKHAVWWFNFNVQESAYSIIHRHHFDSWHIEPMIVQSLKTVLMVVWQHEKKTSREKKKQSGGEKERIIEN